MNVENPWAATQRGPSKYEFEGPRQRPSAAPGKPGTTRPASVTAAAALRPASRPSHERMVSRPVLTLPCADTRSR